MESSRHRPEPVPTDEIRPGVENRLLRSEIVPRPAHVSPGVSSLSLSARARDAALVEGLATGDDAAAVTFVRRFQSAVYGLALAITRDAGTAEDVSQEVFTRAWRAASTYDVRRGSVTTWLLTITRNAAIDAVRVRRPVAVDDELLDSLLLGVLGDDGEDATISRLDGARVASRLRALPPEQARAVVLAVVAGCTAAQVSEREQVPLGTAKTRLRLGLLKLRAAVVADGGDPR